MPTCFVIMPISDIDGYDSGHFNRVYDHIINKACSRAGFEVFRADKTSQTNYIVIDILRRIIESDMVLCDLSGRNPNVLYELGVRQAFNKPVTLIKDRRTDRIFDIQGLRYIEYDETLRVDTAAKAIEEISGALHDTFYQSSREVNSLVQLLGIQPASLPSRIELSEENSVLLQAIGDIRNKVSSLEDKVDRISSGPNSHVLTKQNPLSLSTLKDYLEAGELVQLIGATARKQDQEIGDIAHIELHYDKIILYLIRGGSLELSLNLDEAAAIHITPFPF